MKKLLLLFLSFGYLKASACPITVVNRTGESVVVRIKVRLSTREHYVTGSLKCSLQPNECAQLDPFAATKKDRKPAREGERKGEVIGCHTIIDNLMAVAECDDIHADPIKLKVYTADDHRTLLRVKVTKNEGINWLGNTIILS